MWAIMLPFSQVLSHCLWGLLVLYERKVLGYTISLWILLMKIILDRLPFFSVRSFVFPHNHALPICLEYWVDCSFLVTTGSSSAISKAIFLLGSVLRSLVGIDNGKHMAHFSPPIAGLQLNQKALTTFPDVVLVRVSTPSLQSDSDITVLRHLEKLGCRLVNRPQSILNCINKFWTFQELAGHGVPMPDTFSYGECPWNRVGVYLSQSHLCVFSPQ